MTPIPRRPSEGNPADVVWWKVSERMGGWDVVGVDAQDEPVYECLHLHTTRADAVACGHRSLPDTRGPSQ